MSIYFYIILNSALILLLLYSAFEKDAYHLPKNWLSFIAMCLLLITNQYIWIKLSILLLLLSDLFYFSKFKHTLT
ncbi:MAG: hypothetical protein CMF42_00635 [Legionellales bacterium]|nr:hypothetical protein [Legionellales bacterium]